MTNLNIDKIKRFQKYKIKKRPFSLESIEDKQRREIFGDTNLKSNPLDDGLIKQNKIRRKNDK